MTELSISLLKAAVEMAECYIKEKDATAAALRCPPEECQLQKARAIAARELLEKAEIDYRTTCALIDRGKGIFQ